MCQAYEAEASHVGNVLLRYGTYRAMLRGLDVLPDYCSKHGNYWCGCKPEQSDPEVKAERRRRHELPPLSGPVM